MVPVLAGHPIPVVCRPGHDPGEASAPSSRRQTSSATIRRARPTSSTQFPWGWDELEGIANRSDFDLKQHTEHSGEDLRYFDQETNERFFPYVIEPAAGATRTTFAFLIDAYTEEDVDGDSRTVLKLHPRLAPYKVAVLPLSKKSELIEPAEKLAAEMRRRWMVEVDVTQSIGRRYRRQDEIGTPYCVTVDFETLDDRAVTVRDRDTMGQDRVSLDKVASYISDRLA